MPAFKSYQNSEVDLEDLHRSVPNTPYSPGPGPNPDLPPSNSSTAPPPYVSPPSDIDDDDNDQDAAVVQPPPSPRTLNNLADGPRMIPRPEHPSHDDEGLGVQMNAAQALNETRRSLPILALIYLLWNIAEIIALSVVVGLTWNKPCDEPIIIVEVIGRICRDAMMVPIHLRRVLSYPEHPWEYNIESLSRLWLIVFLLISQHWVTEKSQCRTTAPALWYAGIAVIVMIYVTIFFPLLLLLFICTCLPCVLVVFSWLNIPFGAPQGANETSIDDLRTFEFNPRTYRDPFTHEVTNTVPSDGTDTPTVGPDEDNPNLPNCTICMCDFENKEILKQLPCGHVYHASCIKSWLGVNATCPICRQTILEN